MAIYKFLRQETGQWEEVEEELWRWEVHYEDGSILKQFDDDGHFHQFTEVDQEKIALLRMTSSQFPQSYSVVFSNPNMKPIHFYKNTILNVATPEEKRIRLYCFGYEIKSKPKNQKVVMIITPDNELITTEDPNLITVE